jgi:hypothetical protein
MVILQNYVLTDKTQGMIAPINAHYSLLPRGAYSQTAGQHTMRQLITRDDESPLELYEAINAVQIAEAEGAGKFANDTLATAKQQLHDAQDLDIHKSQRKQEVSYARSAVQTAEDARIIALRKKTAQGETARSAQSLPSATMSNQNIPSAPANNPGIPNPPQQ